MREMRRGVLGLLLLWLAVGAASGQVVTTTVQGTVYRADGTPASGTMLVSWPAFETATNQAVAAGSLTLAVGADGFASLKLAPNAGALPTGSYYTVVYHLSDGTVSKEYWTVPATPTAAIAAVRAQLAPVTVAIQSVSKSYVDKAVASMAATSANFLPLGGGALEGPLVLSGDPASGAQAATKHYVDGQLAGTLPLAGGAMLGPLVLSGNPTASGQASTKGYVDGQVATAVPLTGGMVTGTLATSNAVTKLPRVDVRSGDFAGGADPSGRRDSTAALQAAIAFALANAPSGDASYPAVYLPTGHYLVNGTLRIPNTMVVEGDAKTGTILQETNPTASLITVYRGPVCSTYSCYGALENLTLEGMGKATSGNLLEMNSGFFTLRNLHFFGHGGRGLQMNTGSERVTSYDLSFYQVRWPLVMGGDSNEDYFYNTHVVEAGQTADQGSGYGVQGRYCYSVNCTNGSYEAIGTATAPATILPDPHGSIYIDKAVNVSFIGGSVKSTYMESGVKIWAGSVIRFQNFYHEGTYFGGTNVLSTNHAYIVGGKGEQTYLTGALSASALSANVKDASWMPQFFGAAGDLSVNDGDYYPYVILPQDYDRTSSAPSAYVSGLNKNQYEIVNLEGYTPDGLLHVQPAGGRGLFNTPVPASWPAGSVIEEYTGGGASLELDGVHMNIVQGPQNSGNGWQAGCNQTNVNACGEIVVGYEPDVVAPTANPATNQVGYYTPLNDAYDKLNGATASLKMRHMEMFSSGSNPATGMVVAEHRALIDIEGAIDPERVETTNATMGSSTGMQVGIAAATGGSTVFAPKYANGTPAAVNLTMAGGEVLWDSLRGVFHKHTSMFGMNQQYGTFMNGMQYQSLYCMFDTPALDGGHIQNRVCQGGGPNNTAGNGTGYGGGLEYDSWNGSNWVDMFKVWGQNGTGFIYTTAPTHLGNSLQVDQGATVAGAMNVASALTAASVNGTITVDGTKYGNLNAAWAAAVAAATASGKNQTIWLGPGSFAVTATLNEPTNGACVSVIGSAGTTVGANVSSTATTLTVPGNLNGDVFFLGNATLAEGCTFKDLNVLAGKNATHGWEFQWARGMLLDTVNVNDTTAEGILLGETSGSHQMGSLLRNVTVSYAASTFTPSARPLYGIHLQKTAIDSVMHTVLVRNAQAAAVWNEGTGNTGYGIHGFGYPYTCTTAPCSNTATSSTATNASWATNYVVEDTGGGGNVWTDVYADSPAVSAFLIGANGVEVHGGHVQWPEYTSFPGANFATVTSAVTNNLLISDVSCLGMSGSVNWINYQTAAGVPPTFTSVHHLTGCGNYYQALEPAATTGFSGGGASNNAPGNGAVAAVWAAPKAGSAGYSAFSAQEYTGYQGDLFDGHIAGQMPFFNITYQGTIRSAGGIALSTVINTGSALTLTTGNKTVIANAASGAQTLTLPSCFTPMPDKASPTGLELTIVKSDTSANAVTLQGVSGQTINYGGTAAATLVLSGAGKRSLVCAPDNNWYAY